MATFPAMDRATGLVTPGMAGSHDSSTRMRPTLTKVSCEKQFGHTLSLRVNPLSCAEQFPLNCHSDTIGRIFGHILGVPWAMCLVSMAQLWSCGMRVGAVQERQSGRVVHDVECVRVHVPRTLIRRRPPLGYCSFARLKWGCRR